MGNVTLGIPPELGLAAKHASGARVFIETGTYRCGTALWAAKQFEVVHTVEMYEDYFSRAKHGLAAHKNVTVWFGDSRVVLPTILKGLHEPIVFWLDAHWCGNAEISTGTLGECSLMEELAAIAERYDQGYEDVVLVDDARLFVVPPPRPHDPTQWPTVEQVQYAVRKLLGRPHAPVIVDDVIVLATPKALHKMGLME